MEIASLAEDIIEQIADAVIYSDRTGIIRRWNQGAETTFGFSAAEALGQNLNLIIPPHLQAAHWRGFDSAMTSGALTLDGRPTTTRAVHKSGEKRYVEMTFALVKRGGEGEPLGSVAVARDVTQRMAERSQARGGAK